VVECDRRGEPVLLLGGGSNVVIADAGFDGTAILVRSKGIDFTDESCGGGWVEVAAGEDWDEFVAWSISTGLRGLEALSGIPGRVGATPIQNVGAYGQEVSAVIARVNAFDRREHARVVLPHGECGFGYRSSRFKDDPDRFIIESVAFQLHRGELSAPIAYAELAEVLGVSAGETAPSTKVRTAVLDLRRRKAMVWDSDDHDTWSVGSFFVNPVVDGTDVPPGAPAWPQPDGRVKTSAAWLVEQAGFPKGFALAGSAAAISSRHTLALTNRGGATAAQILELARVIRAGVQDAFGIALTPEPTLIGCALDG
jgi:UDP-N-acetylmuramate dehydrogenase